MNRRRGRARLVEKESGKTYIRARPRFVAVDALPQRTKRCRHGGVLGLDCFRGGQVGARRVRNHVLDPLREGEVGGGGCC